MRSFLVATALASLFIGSSCAPRHEVFVGWTIDGRPAADACAQLKEPAVRFQIANRDAAASSVTDETAAAGCTEGTEGALIQAGNFADIVVEVLDGDIVYGTSQPISVNPGAGGHYAGHDPEELVVGDVELERGRLQAKLRVVGKTCGAAGADSFSVTLKRKSSPLGTEVVGDPDQTVSCPGGEADAIFEFQPVEFGSTYFVVAATTIGGDEFTTDDAGTGEGVVPDSGLTDLTVDLDLVGRPE